MSIKLFPESFYHHIDELLDQAFEQGSSPSKDNYRILVKARRKFIEHYETLISEALDTREYLAERERT